MRDKRVRAVLVSEAERLFGIVTQGNCAIKVVLPSLDAKCVAVKTVMTTESMTVRVADPLEACIRLMAARNFRHLPVVQADVVVGVVSFDDIVKVSIGQICPQINSLETYIKGHGA